MIYKKERGKGVYTFAKYICGLIHFEILACGDSQFSYKTLKLSCFLSNL